MGGRGRRQGLGMVALPSPLLYRPPCEGGPAKTHLGLGGGGQGVERGCLAPQGKGTPPFRVCPKP